MHFPTTYCMSCFEVAWSCHIIFKKCEDKFSPNENFMNIYKHLANSKANVLNCINISFQMFLQIRGMCFHFWYQFVENYSLEYSVSNSLPAFLIFLNEKQHVLQVMRWENKNFMAPFYGWGSTASRQELLWGGSLLFTTKFPEIPGTHFVKLGRMKGWVKLGATQWFWAWDPWIGNPVP